MAGRWTGQSICLPWCKKFTPDELNKMEHKTKDGVIYQMQDRLDLYVSIKIIINL